MTRARRHSRPVRVAAAVVALAVTAVGAAGQEAEPAGLAERLLNDLACGSCHPGIPVESDIRDKAPDLSEAGVRFSPDYLLGFLRFPVRIRESIGLSRMPNFHLDERESLALTLFLQEQIPAGGVRTDFPRQEALAHARAAFPEVSAQVGEGIFRALNCGACHTLDDSAGIRKNAPDLAAEGLRVGSGWLRAWLREPTPIRRFGFEPGAGGRHPDFALSEEEAEVLGAYLMKRTEAEGPAPQEYEPAELSPFLMAKADTLLRRKLPCLGCHRLGKEGGVIGPDLSSLAERLQPEYVDRIIRDPQSAVPGTIMPRVEMPERTLRLIIDYLVRQTLPRDTVAYLSLVDNTPRVRDPPEGSRRVYARRCAPCHGAAGGGDGYNAPYLPVRPTAHADSAYMSTRPDDTLFDGVFSGGYILNKSPRMPPWGFTLERDQIRALVAYMRSLCGCRGPSWSWRDF